MGRGGDDGHSYKITQDFCSSSMFLYQGGMVLYFVYHVEK